MIYVALLVAAHSHLNTCDKLFGPKSLKQINSCLVHRELHWAACHLGVVTLNPALIRGPVGNERVEVVSGRSHTSEKLVFDKGAFTVNAFVLPDAIRTSQPDMATVLQSISVVPGPQQQPYPLVRFLVRRGDYANPCFALSQIYNTWIVMRQFAFTNLAEVVWLDGHARSPLDDWWRKLLSVPAYHVKRIVRNNRAPTVTVNTISAFGDEELRQYNNGDVCSKTSMLHKFVAHAKAQCKISVDRTPTLVLLERRNYTPHPRSDGIVDRGIVDADDVARLLSNYFYKSKIQVAAFETMNLCDQIRTVANADVFMAIHGAGNIFSMFLPPHATFYEFFPPGFAGRRRFQFVSQSINVTYHSVFVSDVHRISKNKVRVDIRPALRKLFS